MVKTLKQLREESGLTLVEVVRRMQEYDVSTPRTHVGLLHIEKRGTDRLSVIRALAHAYSLPFDIVETAARNSTSDICTV